MKFATAKEARKFKDAENRVIPGVKLKVVKSEYMSLTTFDMVPCFCVVVA